MTNVEQIKQAIQSLSKDEHSELVKWLYGLENEEMSEKLNSLNQEFQRLMEELAEIENTPLEQWRRFPQKVAARWEEHLSHLEGFIHYSSSIGRIYTSSVMQSLGAAPQSRVVNSTERTRNLVAALTDLHVKSCSIAGAILPVLRYGYPNSGWILCRTMLENLIVGLFIVKYNEQDAAEQYNGSITIQFSDGNYPPGAKKLYDQYASLFPDAKEHGWASGIDGRKRWNLRSMAQAVGDEGLYTSIFKSESKFSHPDASGFYGDIDDKAVSALEEAHSNPNPNRLYGQTDGVSIITVAYEVAQYLAASTMTLIGASPITNHEVLDSEFEARCNTVLDLFHQASLESPFMRKVAGIQDEP